MSNTQISSSPPVSSNSNEKASTNIEAGLAGFLVPFTIIIVVLFGLNYFDILPISKTFPFLSFLPTNEKSVKVGVQTGKGLPQPSVKPTIKPTIPNLTNVICPIKADLCKTGAILAQTDRTSSFSGLMFDNLPYGTEILMVKDGNIEVKNGKDTTIVTIISKESRIQINYEFPKGAFTQASVSKSEGEVIGSITDVSKGFSNLGGKGNFIFSIQNLDTKTYFRIQPSKDGKFITKI